MTTDNTPKPLTAEEDAALGLVMPLVAEAIARATSTGRWYPRPIALAVLGVAARAASPSGSSRAALALEWADRADDIARQATQEDAAISAFALVSIAHSLAALAGPSDEAAG